MDVDLYLGRQIFTYCVGAAGSYLSIRVQEVSHVTPYLMYGMYDVPR
jgi:hypothetical protein